MSELTDPSLKAGSPELEDQPVSVISVLRQIQGSDTDPTDLSFESRQACTEHLSAEGYSIAEIAAVLKVSERTVSRDKRAIRTSHRLTRDPKLADVAAGQLDQQAEHVIARLRRIGREKGCPPSVRATVELGLWKVECERVQMLQSLGYLPYAGQETHVECRFSGASGREIHTEIVRIDGVLKELQQDDPDLAREIKQLKGLAEEQDAREALDEARRILLEKEAESDAATG